MPRKETIALLHDHHSHVSGRAAYLDCVDLSEVKKKEKAISMINKECSEDKINVVQGWNDSYYSFGSQELEMLSPVFIWNISGHGLIFNESAEKKFKEDFEKPEIIDNLDDPEWVEQNLLEVSKIMMKIEGITEEKIQETYDFLLKRGIYRTDDMLLPLEETLETYKKLGYRDRMTFWADPTAFEGLSENAKTEIEGIKLFADGALGPKTAALKDQYLDGSNGFLLLEKEELRATLEEIEKDKVSIHAIGDRAIDTVVNTLVEMEKKGLDAPETQIEHAQFIDRKTAGKAKRFGIKLSMQPNFSIDSDNYSDRLSEEYLKKNNPFRMLIDEVGFVPGEDLLFGSDGLPYGAKEALNWSLFPVYDSQKLTLDEFVDGYCIDGRDLGGIHLEIDEDEEEVRIEDIKI